MSFHLGGSRGAGLLTGGLDLFNASYVKALGEVFVVPLHKNIAHALLSRLLSSVKKTVCAKFIVRVLICFKCLSVPSPGLKGHCFVLYFHKPY